jgi:Flp pilus assembly protein TadD
MQATSYTQEGQASQAVADFSEALRLDPSSTEVRQDLHAAEKQEGQISSSTDNHF